MTQPVLEILETGRLELLLLNVKFAATRLEFRLSHSMVALLRSPTLILILDSGVLIKNSLPASVLTFLSDSAALNLLRDTVNMKVGFFIQ